MENGLNQRVLLCRKPKLFSTLWRKSNINNVLRSIFEMLISARIKYKTQELRSARKIVQNAGIQTHLNPFEKAV